VANRRWRFKFRLRDSRRLSAVAQLSMLGRMSRYLVLLLLVFMPGCVSYIQSPEALGVVVDAQTGKPIRGATVTRPAISRSWNVPQGLPEITVMTGRYGRFHFSVKRDSNFLLALNETPYFFACTFAIRARGYVTTNITGCASSNTLWRVDLGRIKLNRQ